MRNFGQACSNGCYTGQTLTMKPDTPTLLSPLANLAPVIFSPGPDRSIGFQLERVITPASHHGTRMSSLAFYGREKVRLSMGRAVEAPSQAQKSTIKTTARRVATKQGKNTLFSFCHSAFWPFVFPIHRCNTCHGSFKLLGNSAVSFVISWQQDGTWCKSCCLHQTHA